MKKNKINKLKFNFKSTVTLTIEGYNLERWLNFLNSKNIKVYNVIKIDLKKSIIEVPSYAENEIVNFLKSKNVKIIEKKYNGFSKIFNFFKLRYGVLIGVFIAFCFFVVSLNYIWKIDIIGNNVVKTSEIVEVLNENGINYFNSLNKHTNNEIEKIILDNFDEISMVSVIHKGTSIIINIKEKVINDEYENLDNIQPLISNQDGVITKIELIQGTLMVKAGDIIKAGDILVAPYVIDSSGNKIPIKPKANIFADVFITGQSFHENEKEVTIRTGNVIIERKMSFLNKEFFSKKEEVSFIYYDLVINEEYLSDAILPIKYETLYYYELEIKKETQDFELVEKEKIEEAKNNAIARLNNTDEIVSENHVITENDNRTIVDYIITVNRKITL